MGDVLQIAAGLVVAYTAGARVNLHTPRTPLIDRITWSVLGAAGLMACLGVPLSRVPVVVEVRAEIVEHRPGLLRLHVTGRKPVDRGMCELRAIDAYVVDGQGVQFEVPHLAEHDPSPGNTRPPGRQDFGVWRMVYPAGLDITTALFVAHHRCAWWMPITRTQIGPVPVRPARPS